MGFHGSGATFGVFNDGQLISTLADAADQNWQVTVKVPGSSTSISSIRLIYKRDDTGNVNLKFTTCHIDTAAMPVANQTDTTDTFTVYAGGAADGTLATITVPAGAFNGLTGIGVDSLIGLRVAREASVDVNDTYAAGFRLMGALFTFA